MTRILLGLLLSSSALAADPAGIPASATPPPPPLPASTKETDPAATPEMKSTPSPVKVSGVLFASWGMDLSEDADYFNAFNIDRAYVRADAKLNDKLSTRVTLDAGRESAQTVTVPTGESVVVPEDLRLRIFLKHAWLAYKPSKAIEIKGGMIDTPFLGFVESYQGLRWTARTFLDDQKLESTTDLGVMASGKHADGLVSWGAGVYNGEFFTNPEVGSGKSLQGRLTVDPLAGEGAKVTLPITVFVDENLQQDDAPGRLTFAGDVGFAHENLLVSGQVAGRSSDGVSGLGQSFQLVPKITDVGYLYTRLDRWDPDTATDDDGNMKIIGGLGHDFYEKVGLGVQYERTMLEATPDVPLHGVFVRMQAGY